MQTASEIKVRPVGDLVLRGRSEALRAFEPLTPETFNPAATRQYLEAFATLEADDAAAMPAFAALIGPYPHDRLPNFPPERAIERPPGVSALNLNGANDGRFGEAATLVARRS
ncbi:hypothetical protein [Bradyrhizobium ottawaense]|uniref:hypothetical protein n=1 Tax=Bradyrhizobium ottawaense TaxID=931866 RepID=UPI003FA0983B